MLSPQMALRGRHAEPDFKHRSKVTARRSSVNSTTPATIISLPVAPPVSESSRLRQSRGRDGPYRPAEEHEADIKDARIESLETCQPSGGGHGASRRNRPRRMQA